MHKDGKMKINRMGWQWLVLSLTAFGVLLLAGCASFGGTRPAGMEQPTGKASSAYLIGPEDELQIYVRDNPNLSVSVPVRPDGKISIPLVQSMQAAGKTPTQLSQDLEKALSQYIRTPTVTVIVRSFHGAYQQQIKVVGQAVKPQAIPYRQGMTVLDVMIDVGGLTQFAAGNSAVLVRRVDGKEHRIPLRLGSLLNKGDVNANRPVRPGDTIFIPESMF